MDQVQKKNFYKYSLLFILINAVFVYYDSFYFALIPFVLAIVFFAVWSIDKVLYLIVFFVPLSIPLREYFPGLGIDFYIPTEPLLFGVLLLFLFKLGVEQRFDKRVLTHPISIVIYIQLLWILITSLTSSMPIVSIKFLIARLWFLAGFYFLATQLFRKRKAMNLYIFLYVLPLLIVIAYTLNRHFGIGIFDKDAANYVMSPFYSDHTSYGAVLAMLIPPVFHFVWKGNFNATQKLLISVALIILIIALIFSFTRAAWLSLVLAIGAWGVVKLRIPFKYILSVSLLFIGLFFAFRTQIILSLNQNKQDSSRNIEEHIQSMSNIRTDASNLERLNRWSCAWRMFKQRPVFGWGPGTYMFQYASFQLSYEKTIISTNAHDLGNAHSEYIGPLAESGIFGFLNMILLLCTVLYSALSLYNKIEDKELKAFLLSITLGLITYFIHGTLNNFLDTDKASVLFWGFVAMIVSIDVYYTQGSNQHIE